MPPTYRAVHGFDGNGMGQRWGSHADNRTPEAVARGQGALDCFYGYERFAQASGGSTWAVFPDGTQTGYVRFYINITAMPVNTSGDGRVVICHWTSSLLSLTLRYDGRLEAWNPAKNELLGESKILNVPFYLDENRWYLIEMMYQRNTIYPQPAPNPPYESNAVTEVRVDGTRVIYLDRAGGSVDLSPNEGFDQVSAFTDIAEVSVGGGTPHATIGTCTDEWAVCIDDMAVATGDWLGPGITRTIFPKAVATAGWGISSSNDAGMCSSYDLDAGNGGASAAYANSTTSEEVLRFTMPTLRESGVLTPTRYVTVMLWPTTYDFAGKVLLKVNGVETEETQGNGVIVALPDGAWWETKFSVTLQPDDEIEIGIKKDATTTVRRVRQMALVVEARTGSLPIRPNTVTIASGTYTGNGTQQEIACGLNPDWVIVQTTALVSNAILTFRGRGVNGYEGYPYSLTAPYLDGITRFTENGFVVNSDAQGLNASSETYVWIAGQDPRHRMLTWGAWRCYIPGLPSRGVFANPQFTPDASYFTAAPAAGSCLNVGPTHPAGYASELVMTALSPRMQDDEILSVSRGEFVLGSGSWYQAGMYGTNARHYLCVQDNAVSQHLIACGSYTGDGTGARTVPLPASMANATPVLIWIHGTRMTDPVTTDRYVYAPAMGTRARRLSAAGSDADAITAVGVGTVTVGSTMNRSEQVYHIVAFATGTDELPRKPLDPEENPGPYPNDPDTEDPRYTDWPEDKPGLLGMLFGVRQYVHPPVPFDPREYGLPCEQRTFPVDVDQTEFDLACEQRTFPVDVDTVEFKLSGEQRDFDALAEYP